MLLVLQCCWCRGSVVVVVGAAFLVIVIGGVIMCTCSGVVAVGVVFARPLARVCSRRKPTRVNSPLRMNATFSLCMRLPPFTLQINARKGKCLIPLVMVNHNPTRNLKPQ